MGFLRRSSRARLPWRTMAIAVMGTVAALAASAPAHAAAAPDDAMASASYGFAGADWQWTGPGRAENMTLVVADWGCDAKPVYAYFKVHNTNGRVWSTSTRRYDYSGCDLPDYTTYRGLSVSDNYNIAYLQPVICREGGPCTDGGLSGRNPYA